MNSVDTYQTAAQSDKDPLYYLCDTDMAFQVVLLMWYELNLYKSKMNMNEGMELILYVGAF